MPTPTAASLAEFRSWLGRRGRSDGTQDQYVRAVRGLYRQPDPLARLTDRSLSACYRNHLATALRAWATFCKDEALGDSLEEIKLPHNARQSVRTPLSEEEWFGVLDALDADTDLDPMLRAVLLIIATRGLRCSDALRIQKGEIQRALKTGTLGFVGKGERRITYAASSVEGALRVLSTMPGPPETPVWSVLTAGKKETAARRVRKAVERLAERIGFDKGELFAHRFRHSFVNHLLEELRGDPRAAFLLQDAMNWASANTARNYVKRAEQHEIESLEQKMWSRRKAK